MSAVGVSPGGSPAESHVARVGSWALVLPADWWTIALTDDDARRRGVDALVERQFGHSDSSAVLKRRTRDLLLDAADRAAEVGGRLMAVSLMRAGGLPVSATLITYRLGVTDLSSTGVRELEARLRADVPATGALDLGEVPAGLALRKTSRRPGPGDVTGGEPGLEQLVVEYWIEPAGGGPLLYLVFTTGHVEVTEAMTGLFDAIVGGVSLVDG